MYKIIHNLIDVPADIYLKPATSAYHTRLIQSTQTCRSLRAAKLKLRYLNRCLQPKPLI